ncbi:MAG: phospholipid carrier-dependent glycosyltransferase [Gaiellaceae bacterium]
MTRVVALVAIVVAGTIAYGSLGSQLRGPSVFADELIYMDATRSIADGHRPIERDRPYGRGLLFPAVGAPVFAAMSNDRKSYIALRWLNALLFSLTAIPAYLLARRVLGVRWSVAVAAGSVAAPSALYTGMILTESAAYLTGTIALYALALALERPTTRRQLGALAAIVFGALARPQLAALVAAFPLGLGVRWMIAPPGARPGRDALRRLWPSAVAFGAVALLTVAAFASGRASLKDYQDVFTSYNPLAVLEWGWFTLGDLSLYLAFVPVVVAPIVVTYAWRRGRAGDRHDAAFVALLASATFVTTLVVAAFSSAEFGFSRLHDRYLFYVVPLWLILTALWVERRLPPSRGEVVVGGVAAAILVATLPPRLLVHDGSVQFDAVGTGVWSRIRDLDPARPSGLRLALALAALGVAALVLAVAIASASRRSVVVLPILVVFIANAAIVWKARIADADVHVFSDNRAATWSWVDRAVPAGRSVTDVYVDSGPCLERARDPFRWTEFFNGRIGPVLRLGLPAPPGVVTDGTNAHIAGSRIVRTSNGPVSPGYVVAPPGLTFAGTRIATGTIAQLQLWRIDGKLRVLNAASNAQAITVACPAGA